MIVLLDGLTGAGKTDLLHGLRSAGQQVLDLEMLAGHRGSAFGGMGLGPQPSHAAFQGAVREFLAEADPLQPLWVEAEGDYIGAVGVPVELRDAMAAAPRIGLVTDVADRVRRINGTYGGCPLPEWLAALTRIAPRLGPARTHSAHAALLAGDTAAAIEVLLGYYDRGYTHRARSVRGPLLGTVEVGEAGAPGHAGRAVELARRLVSASASTRPAPTQGR